MNIELYNTERMHHILRSRILEHIRQCRQHRHEAAQNIGTETSTMDAAYWIVAVARWTARIDSYRATLRAQRI